jgi:hypothetical protein
VHAHIIAHRINKAEIIRGDKEMKARKILQEKNNQSTTVLIFTTF